jgi:uncharacterized protein YndB with AHSA1/START domain
MTDNTPFTITRTFDAGIDRVWAAWTEPSRIAAWMVPKGSGELTMLEHDLRPGGVSHSTYVGPAGMGQIYGKYVYRAVEPKTKLVWEHSFSDAQGGITRHPLAPLWPLVLLTTVTFKSVGGDKTELTLEWEPFGATPQEEAAFQAAKIGMAGGWGGSFENLAELLKDRN